MRLDALAAATAFALAVSALLAVYVQALETAYVGMAECWARAEQAATDLASGRRPSSDLYIVVRLVSKRGVREYSLGEARRGRSCYTYRILENMTLLKVEVRC